MVFRPLCSLRTGQNLNYFLATWKISTLLFRFMSISIAALRHGKIISTFCERRPFQEWHGQPIGLSGRKLAADAANKDGGFSISLIKFAVHVASHLVASLLLDSSMYGQGDDLVKLFCCLGRQSTGAVTPVF